MNFPFTLAYFNKKVSEYDQEIPQSQTTDKPMAARGRATQPSRDTRNTNYAKQQAFSLPHQDDCKTRIDIKQRATKQYKCTGFIADFHFIL